MERAQKSVPLCICFGGSRKVESCVQYRLRLRLSRNTSDLKTEMHRDSPKVWVGYKPLFRALHV